MTLDSIVASAHNADPYVELARTQQGTLWRKHVLTRGNLIHPVTKEKLNLDDAFMETLIHNFEDKVCDTVSVPLANDQNAHNENPDNNIGEVIGFQYDKPNGKLYALMDIRDAERAKKMGTTYLGASMMMSTNYVDTRDGKPKGPTALHCAITNRAYLNNLDPFEKIIAASAPALSDVAILEPSDESTTDSVDKLEEEGASVTGDRSDDPAVEELEMTLEEMLEALKTDHGINVTELQASVKTAEESAKAATDKVTELSSSLTAALSGTDVVKLSKDDEITAEDIVGAVAELAENNVQLTGRVDSLAKESAGVYVDKLVGDGFVLPAQRDTFVELRLSNTDLFDKLIPEKPLVALNVEKGAGEGADVKKELDVDAEIARLTNPGGAAAQYVKTNAN